LVFFAISIAILPIIVYFASLKYVFSGESSRSSCERHVEWFDSTEKDTTYAALSAVGVVNLLLAAYIVVAVREDPGEHRTVEATKKDAKEGKSQ
jgi:hypothetical protein